MTRRFRASGTQRLHDPNQDIAWSEGAGVWLWDSEGRRYLDCVSGYSANVLGHCHPDIAAVVGHQATKLMFATGGESSLRQEFEERICHVVSESSALIPPSPSSINSLKVWLSTTGARAIEVAWRIAFHRKAGALVTFDLGYHGRSIATSYASDTTQQDCLLTGASRVVRFSIPFPRVGAGSSQTMEEACNESLDAFQRLLRTHSEPLSALLIEPAIGSRGYYFAPADYFRRLASLARENGLLVIADEVQMGLGRLGAMVASHSQGWSPDLLVLGKALGGGSQPVSCVVGLSEIMDQLPAGYESETFAGSPIACRIGIEVLRILSSTGVIKESSSLHTELRLELASVLPSGSVDGIGSATVIDLSSAVTNLSARQTHTRSSCLKITGTMAAYEMARQLRENGILVHVTGSMRDRIAVIPPLSICSAEMSMVIAECISAWRRIAQDTSCTVP